MTARIPADRHRCASRRCLLARWSALPSCSAPAPHTDEDVATASIPDDYRQRHPIAIQEADRSVVVFVGQARGGLSASQRTDVMGLAQAWLHEGTGAIIADVPVDTPNARAAADALREIRSLLAAAGVPPRGLVVRQYHPEDPRQLRDDPAELSENHGGCRALRPVAGGPRTLGQEPELRRKQAVLQFRLRLSAQHGGDDRQSVGSRATAAETPAYTARRTEAFEKYRKGNTTATAYPEADKAKLSDTGK